MAIHTQRQLSLFKLGLDQKQFPQILYKYTSFDNLKLILEHQTIKFSKISEFNDIKECFAVLDCECSREEWQKYLILVAPHQPKRIIEETLDAIMNDPEHAKSVVREAISSTNENLGILCLAENSDINLMWAHYTDNHKGVCLEFALAQDLDTFCFPKKVEYDDEINKYNYIKSYLINGGNEATNSIYHKSSDWGYEKEWRIVRINGAEIVKFKIEALRTIIFGKNTALDQIKEIKSMCQTKGYTHIQFKQINVDPTTGNLIQVSV